MVVEVILFSILLVILLGASLTDIKTKEVPDTLSYGLIAAVLGVSLVYSFFSSWLFFVLSVTGALVAFGVGYFFYWLKLLGGADVKLFAGIGGVFANFSILSLPLLLFFGLLLITIGSCYSLLWALTLFFKKPKAVLEQTKKRLIAQRTTRSVLLGLVAVLFVSLFFLPSPPLKIIMGIVAVSIIGSFYLSLFIMSIDAVYFIRWVPVKKLTEGDWLARDVTHRGHILCSAKKPCLDANQISLMKKHGIKKALVKVGIPFVPAIFLTTLVTVLVYVFFHGVPYVS